MGKTYVENIALVSQAAFLHHAARPKVGGQSEGDDVANGTLFECEMYECASHFGAAVLTPEVGVNGIVQFGFPVPIHHGPAKPCVADELTLVLSPKHPKSQAMLQCL